MSPHGFELNRGLEPLLNVQTFKFGTWDVEARDWWSLEMIGVWDGENYFHFHGPTAVPDYLNFIMQTKYDNFRWFAHFGGRYDLNFIFDYLRTRTDVQVSFYCSGSMVIQLTIRRKGVVAKLCDSYRLFYMPGNASDTRTDNKTGLRSLGIAFDVKHKKGEIDYEDIRYSKRLIEYNELDCRCLWEVIDRFFVETGVYSETFATHALRVWRKDFLKETIWKPSPAVLDLCRSSYHGGRVEVFKHQNSDLHAYDVNSMYPHVMRDPMPVDYIGESKKLKDKYYGFVDALVYVPEIYVPTLPVRMEKLYFPCGDIRGTWTTEELIHAEKTGSRILKIFKAYYFHTREIFRDYVLKLYELKKTATEPTRTIAKGLLNALYGKFGQNPTKKIYCTENAAPAGSWAIIQPDGNPSGFCYYERTSQSAYLLPHLASAVTSKARLVLRSKLNDHSYYCDTDSVFTDEIIETSKELGEWSEVGSGEALFIQPKLYKFRGVWKSKGLNREQSIDDFISGSANTSRRTISIREALRSGVRATQHVETQKVLRETKPKRQWIDNHTNTRPWDIREITKE
jgi:DNA polymerase type B, organellar and viral